MTRPRAMQVAKWGNSLAVRIPAGVASRLHLKEGDELEAKVVGERTLELERRMTKAEALESLKQLAIKVPADFKFNRDELYERD